MSVERSDSVFEVDEWTVIMAIRYGTGRLTYANLDASRLAQKFWDRFSDNDKRTIFADASRLTDSCSREEWSWLLNATDEVG